MWYGLSEFPEDMDNHMPALCFHNTLEPAAQSEIQIPGLIFCRL